ncbi:MAG: hypothetical protein HY689_06525 [Chloroflexi bacterium]|nr:hypothetical protein [Chloroflexota bacterium]
MTATVAGEATAGATPTASVTPGTLLPDTATATAVPARTPAPPPAPTPRPERTPTPSATPTPTLASPQPAPAPRTLAPTYDPQLGRIVGEGCSAYYDEGAHWPEMVGGVEGVVTCSQNYYYFQPSQPETAPVRITPKPTQNEQIRNTIVCYYGNRVAASMGILGQFPLEELARRLRELAGIYDRLNGERRVTPCFDYVYLVANSSSPPYAHYTPRLDLFEETLKFAEEQNILVFIDLQLGYRAIREEVQKVLPYLMKPNIHLAIDTEFFMSRRGGVPGDTLGSMDATDINLIQDMMQQFISEHRLPDKILKVYQFDPIMLTNKQLLNVDFPNVHLLINADGVGYSGVGGKVHDYQEYAGEPANALGLKLFLAWDNPLMSPEEVMALTPPPQEVVYQ